MCFVGHLDDIGILNRRDSFLFKYRILWCCRLLILRTLREFGTVENPDCFLCMK